MAKHPGGRPSIYTDELAEKICKLIISGLSLRKILDQEGMPSRDTVHNWILNRGEFSDQYARACKLRREYKFEKLEDIAETEEDVSRARLRVDVIKWQLSKEEPKKYGDKIDMTSDGDKLGVNLSAEQAEQLIRARAERSNT